MRQESSHEDHGVAEGGHTTLTTTLLLMVAQQVDEGQVSKGGKRQAGRDVHAALGPWGPEMREWGTRSTWSALARRTMRINLSRVLAISLQAVERTNRAKVDDVSRYTTCPTLHRLSGLTLALVDQLHQDGHLIKEIERTCFLYVLARD